MIGCEFRKRESLLVGKNTSHRQFFTGDKGDWFKRGQPHEKVDEQKTAATRGKSDTDFCRMRVEGRTLSGRGESSSG